MDKEVKGSLTLNISPDVVLRALTDLANAQRLIPGVKSVVRTGPNNAKVTVDTKLGTMSFEREFDLTITQEAASVVYLAKSYGLDVEARVSLVESAGSTLMNYTVCLRGTSFSGNMVLRMVGEPLIRDFSDQFSANLKRIQEVDLSDS